MSDSNNNMKHKKIVSTAPVPIKTDQLQMSTPVLLVILVVALVILKSFIYIKDTKRHGR